MNMFFDFFFVGMTYLGKRCITTSYVRKHAAFAGTDRRIAGVNPTKNPRSPFSE
jgi:hypothetical protein